MVFLSFQPFLLQEIDAQDERIHCIFYFIPPHRMKDIDIEFIQQLSGLALIVPVVAKADTMTYHEHKAYLSVVRSNLRMLQDCTDHPIIYDFEEGDATIFMPPEDSLIVPADESESAESDPQEPHQESVMAEVEVAHDAHEVNYNIDTDGGDLHVSSVFALEKSDDMHCSISGSGIGFADLLEGLQSQHFSPGSKSALAEAPSVTSELMNDEDGDERDAEAPAAASAPAGKATLPRIPNVFALVCDLNEKGLREYQYGTLEINNKEHSDFRRLQELIFENGTHLIKMRELTERMSIRLFQESQRECAWLKQWYPVLKHVMMWVNHIVLWIVYTVMGVYTVQFIGSCIFL